MNSAILAGLQAAEMELHHLKQEERKPSMQLTGYSLGQPPHTQCALLVLFQHEQPNGTTIKYHEQAEGFSESFMRQLPQLSSNVRGVSSNGGSRTERNLKMSLPTNHSEPCNDDDDAEPSENVKLEAQDDDADDLLMVQPLQQHNNRLSNDESPNSNNNNMMMMAGSVEGSAAKRPRNNNTSAASTPSTTAASPTTIDESKITKMHKTMLVRIFVKTNKAGDEDRSFE